MCVKDLLWFRSLTLPRVLISLNSFRGALGAEPQGVRTALYSVPGGKRANGVLAPRRPTQSTIGREVSPVPTRGECQISQGDRNVIRGVEPSIVSRN